MPTLWLWNIDINYHKKYNSISVVQLTKTHIFVFDKNILC